MKTFAILLIFALGVSVADTKTVSGDVTMTSQKAISDEENSILDEIIKLKKHAKLEDIRHNASHSLLMEIKHSIQELKIENAQLRREVEEVKSMKNDVATIKDVLTTRKYSQSFFFRFSRAENKGLTNDNVIPLLALVLPNQNLG